RTPGARGPRASTRGYRANLGLAPSNDDGAPARRKAIYEDVQLAPPNCIAEITAGNARKPTPGGAAKRGRQLRRAVPRYPLPLSLPARLPLT
ncbi:MAG TPA: hypothetical protein VJT73_18360, partial [Polyangiaceae bacterium]|nr:hypothetical protein [Polyangiaceae bacterium]